MGAVRVVPWHLRLGLPLLTAATVGLLVAAHVCKGASTQVDGHAPFGTLSPHAASDDNLISAVRRLADARVWFMVFIVAFLSGLWPYAKLLATLGVVALADLGKLSREAGYGALCLLEVLGKYSFADVILICFNAVIFDISTGGEYRIVVFGSLELNLYMHLKFASVALVVAVTASALLTHWAAYELEPGHKEKEPAPGSAEEEEALLPEDGGRSSSSSGSEAEGRFWPGFATAVAAAGGLALLLAGSVVTAVKVERGGFLGNLIRPNSDQNLELSIFSLTSGMWEAGRSRSDGGTLFFAFLFIILVFVAPLLEFAALAACGLAAVAKARRGFLLRFERIAAWLSSFGVVDVYLLVCLAVRYEIKTVVEFNIGDECKPFASIMDNKALLTVAGLGFAASSSCFDPHASLQSGWWILLVSVVLRTCAWRGVGLSSRPPEAPLHEA